MLFRLNHFKRPSRRGDGAMIEERLVEAADIAAALLQVTSEQWIFGGWDGPTWAKGLTEIKNIPLAYAEKSHEYPSREWWEARNTPTREEWKSARA